MYVVDTGNQVLRAIDLDTEIITTLAGSGQAGNGAGGPARSVDLQNPHDVAVGPDGTVFLSDTGNHCVRALLADDTLLTVAGVCGESGFSGDGGDPNAALLYYPSGIDVGPDGTLFIADTYNHVIRRVDHPLDLLLDEAP
jgi:sugar lactone lactonase YvrE